MQRGDRIAHFEIVGLIGAGGMGHVYRARDTRLGRDVAIKVLPAEFASDPDRLRRFEQEARAVAALDHPNILALYDIGTHEGAPYLVTQLLEGESLRETLDRRPFPVRKAVEVGVQVAHGLSVAHEKGIVHRDLKPGNVFLTKEGRVKILDFGLAKLVTPRGQGEPAQACTVVDATDAGTTLGTAGYMSPEQVRGQAIDARSDIFSFGCLLYEMISGRSPFKGDTSADTMSAILKNDPPVLEGPERGVSSSLEHVIRRCLEKEPSRRFSSANDLAFALSEASGPAVVSAPHVALEPARPHRRLLIHGGVAAAVVLAVVVAVLLRSRHASAPAAGPKRIAVLPFENLGAKEDDYFADGIADEVRAKLTSVSGLAVIARTSSNEYRKTTKKLQEIGKELDAEYLLTGTVRFASDASGGRRVQVSPELSVAETAESKWAQPFDATLTDVFAVQGEIATRVAQALDVALSAGSREQLEAKPTQNLAAYEAYLRGEEASQAMVATEPPSLRRAIDQYEQAVALDAGFVEAWARLSLASSMLYFNGTPTPALAARAREAAEKALALAPDRPEGHAALGEYDRIVLADKVRALSEIERARSLAPGNAVYLVFMAGAERTLGRWEASLGHLEEARRLDPRSVVTLRRLGSTALLLRRPAVARQALDAALALVPANLEALEYKAMVFLQEGDRTGAQAVLKSAPKEVEPTALVADVANFWDLVWVLDEAQRDLLLRLTPRAFGDDRSVWSLCLMQAYALRRDEANMRTYAEIARAATEDQLAAVPDDAQRHAFLGLSLAYLGRKADAVREAERAVDLLPISRDAYIGPYVFHQCVRVYILTGEHEKALDGLQALLEIPYYLSPGWLSIDPNFAPLKGNPRFEELLKQK